jgi:hypothetical protein
VWQRCGLRAQPALAPAMRTQVVLQMGWLTWVQMWAAQVVMARHLVGVGEAGAGGVAAGGAGVAVVEGVVRVAMQGTQLPSKRLIPSTALHAWDS